MKLEISLLLAVISLVSSQSSNKKFKSEDCEVCMKVINKLKETLTSDIKQSPAKIQQHFKEFCAKLKNSKEDRFCFYIGGKEDSATSILNTLSAPLANSHPTEVICKKLYQADNQICELRYDKVFDLKSVDLTKLKVKDLKKIINDMDEVCKGCIEKIDYINRINELKPSHTEL